MDLFDLPAEEALQHAVDNGMANTARIFARIIKANTERQEAIKILADLVRAITNKGEEEAQIAAFEQAVKFLENNRA